MKVKIAKTHDEEWFEERERIIAEPINNTIKYYKRPFIIAIIVYIAMLFVTYDYYGAIKGFARLNEWFMKIPLVWSILLSVAIFATLNGGRALALFLTVKRMREQEEYARCEFIYHILSFPWFGLFNFTTTADFAIWAIVNGALFFARLFAHYFLKGYIKAGIECFYYINKYDEQRENYLGKARSVTNTGSPGSGKTVLGGTMSKTLSEQRWEKLQFDYFTENARKNYYIQTLNAEKLVP